MSWRNYPRSRYSHEISDLGNGEWYWKLYYDGERVNGGITKSELRARDRVKDYTAQHQRSIRQHQYVLDSESGEWVSKADRYIMHGR